jgi:hypothetical protein
VYEGPALAKLNFWTGLKAFGAQHKTLHRFYTRSDKTRKYAYFRKFNAAKAK